MYKTPGEIWDAQRLIILVQKSLFCMQKPQLRAGTIETSNSDAKQAVVHAQNDRSCLGPTETCKSGPKVTILHPKTTVDHRDF